MAQGEVFTPKHDLSMISGGAPGNVNEEESMNLANNNFDLEDMRNSLMDFKTNAPPQGQHQQSGRRSKAEDEEMKLNQQYA